MSGYKVTTSSELMENYIQADYLAPQEKFIALQTDVGGSLLLPGRTSYSIADGQDRHPRVAPVHRFRHDAAGSPSFEQVVR